MTQTDPKPIPLRCQCGAIHGQCRLVPGAGQRVFCYCLDCQAYARWLGIDGMLDHQGGSDIYQTRPSLVTLAGRLDDLACVRLSEKGLLRWYTRCCRTPVANSMASPRMPFMGLVQPFMDHSGGPARDVLLGPPVGKAFGKRALDGMPEGADATVSLRLILRTAALLARSALARGHRPSPLFDSRTGVPRAAPEVVPPEERV